MPFQSFDRTQLKLLPLEKRYHDLQRETILRRPSDLGSSFEHPALPILAEKIIEAANSNRAVIFACGAHVLREGNSPLLIDLMRRGILQHLALNGAGAIHDFEMAFIGQTCESVAQYIKDGQFGLWIETGQINQAAIEGHQDGIGLGEAIGRMIEQNRLPYRDESLLAAGSRLEVPVTVHVSIGQDIIHEHPNFDGAATGATSFTDFLIFTESVNHLEGGVFLNIGSAVMGPEIYLKSLAMARNVASQQNRTIRHFTTGVFDLLDLGGDLSKEAPKGDSRYYFRPYKTILVRTVADGGQSYYVRGRHRDTLPALYEQIVARLS